WVVLEIRVLHEEDVARGRLESVAQRSALALIALLQEEAHLAALDAALEDLAGAVGRSVVDDDELALEPARGGFEDTADDLGNRGGLVVHRYDDAQASHGRVFYTEPKKPSICVHSACTLSD